MKNISIISPAQRSVRYAAVSAASCRTLIAKMVLLQATHAELVSASIKKAEQKHPAFLFLYFVTRTVSQQSLLKGTLRKVEIFFLVNNQNQSAYFRAIQIILTPSF